MAKILQWGYETIGPRWMAAKTLLAVEKLTSRIEFIDVDGHHDQELNKLRSIILQQCIRIISPFGFM